ncbi:methyl-accepting chemotaxis protein [Rhizobium halophytocola]|uniref:Methyl-accepting chemotaxis protein n=1 Tax=Rhizobium halophytocola TaxID=735519 RepID=A0ABS4E5F8_9HYPH|nr:HAMP domain-containing methyl-accepting chemotaxis protein [Rhizobium halophytocola]MBP1853186.1 methyl-accepting chemotaxis protein [Rhizobium halophytocola]
MFIDKALARFKIQTKVLVFICPFVISISAVGLTGIYASGLLQNRIEISNGVLQALSGFKSVYVGMGDFLRTPSEEARDALEATLERQRSMLGALGSEAVGAEGSKEIGEATALLDDVGQRIARSWDLFSKETALHAEMDKSVSTLISEQDALLTYATGVQETLAGDEAQAKTLLREAEQITSGANFISKLVSDYNDLRDPKAKLELLGQRIGELDTTAKAITEAVPIDKKVYGQTISDQAGQIRKALDIGIANDATVGGLDRNINLMRPMAIRLQGIATMKARTATEVFGKLDGPTIEAARLLAKTRQVLNAVSDVHLAAVRFLATAAKEDDGILAQRLDALTEKLDALAADNALEGEGRSHAEAMKPLVGKIGTSAKQFEALDADRANSFREASGEIDRIWTKLTDFATLQKQVAGEERNKADTISIGSTLLGILIAIFAGIGLVMTFKGPIGQITAAMRRLADGDLDTAIRGESRHDEIGDMARALGVFKDNARAKVEIEARSGKERAAADTERARTDEEKREFDQQIQFAVSELAKGLERLSNGDISATIDTPFIGRLEQLRKDFNTSLTGLRETMGDIVGNIQRMEGSVQQVAHSAEELSRRTENQAASLEETAAAVDEITVTVRSSAERARDANKIVTDTRSNADGSVKVVESAVAAMGRIEGASKKIEQIIDVIEDIAFQTNLLALNAGIEAARAGEAGRGFAVVAHEVRELAQRSGVAANEIKGLISASTTEVDAGSRLVSETGKALTAIGQQIATISGHMQDMATAAHDQSVGLNEVNGSVNQMDQLTQQNAAMAEEASAASRQLADETRALMSLVSRFNLGGSVPAKRRAA